MTASFSACRAAADLQQARYSNWQVTATAAAAEVLLHDGACVQVGMRHFHKQKNHYHCPIVNLDKLWTLVGEEVRPCAGCRHTAAAAAAVTAAAGATAGTVAACRFAAAANQQHELVSCGSKTQA
jgi:hypothetical protein